MPWCENCSKLKLELEKIGEEIASDRRVVLAEFGVLFIFTFFFFFCCCF
jgi:hypothetical protein